MGNCLFRCMCSCCINKTDEYQPLIKQNSVYYDYRLSQTDLQFRERQYKNKKTSKIAQFNDYDDVTNINSHILLIYGIVREIQNSFPDQSGYWIIPQTIINIICSYHTQSTQSIYEPIFSYQSTRSRHKKQIDIEMNKIANNVSKLFVNENSLFMLTGNDHIYVYGDNKACKLGIVPSIQRNSYSKRNEIQSISTPITNTFYHKNRFKVISSSSIDCRHTFGITFNHQIYGYGYNGSSQLGLKDIAKIQLVPDEWGENIQVYLPMLIDIKHNIIDIRVGKDHTLMLTDKGKVLGCGQNRFGQLAMKTHRIETPTLIEALKYDIFSKIRCGAEFSLVLNNEGILYGFGLNDKGQIAGISTHDVMEPHMIKFADNMYHIIVTMECGLEHVCCLDEYGNIYIWGNKYAFYVNIQQRITHIACGYNHTVAIDDEMNLYLLGLPHSQFDDDDYYNNNINKNNTICSAKKAKNSAVQAALNRYNKILNADNGNNHNNKNNNNNCKDNEKEKKEEVHNIDNKNKYDAIHQIKYEDYNYYIDYKTVVDIKAGGESVYLCVLNH